MAIQVSRAGIAELDRHDRPAVREPREQLREIELRYGPAGERLAVQTIIEIVVIGRRGIIVWLIDGGYANLNSGARSVTFILGGALLLWRAWRPRHHLRIAPIEASAS